MQLQRNHQTKVWEIEKTISKNHGWRIFVCILINGNTLISWLKDIIHMMSYRTSMQIVGDLLTATQQSGQEGIKTTSLLTKANLSHSRLSKFLSNLTGAGLINKIEFDGKNTFVITQKGRQYLETYVKFANVAESFGLEL